MMDHVEARTRFKSGPSTATTNEREGSNLNPERVPCPVVQVNCTP